MTIDVSTSPERRAQSLVFAISHEIGNHLGAIRLHAHLLDEDLDAKGLARASVEIDGLAGRGGPLLALMRPILLPESVSVHAVRWASLLRAVGRQLEDEGTRGIRFTLNAPSDSELEGPRADWLHSLLVALLEATLATLSGRSAIRVDFEFGGAESVLVIEDDGPEEDLSAEAALRGRPLVISIARWLLASVGGRVQVKRDTDKTVVALIFVNQS